MGTLGLTRDAVTKRIDSGQTLDQLIVDRYRSTMIKLDRPYRIECVDDVDVYDQLLHQSLTKIFSERRLTSCQIKDLLRGDNSEIKSILVHREPHLGELFSNEQLKKATLLWIAVLCRCQNSVELLVRSGADVNETFDLASNGFCKVSTILHVMVRRMRYAPDEQLIRLVMDHGADVGALDYNEYTVLHYAVILDRVDLAQMFLDNGADVSCDTLCVCTPFDLITNKKRNNPMAELIVKALALKKCIQPTIELEEESLLIKGYPKLWDYYKDCIDYAIYTKIERFAKSCTFFQLLTQCPCSIAWLMLEDSDFKSGFDMYNLEALYYMYEEDLLRAFERAQNHFRSMVQVEGARYSCECYCENLYRRKLCLLLHEEISQGQVEQVEMLLQKGADVNFFGENRRTPLLEAARCCKADKLLPLLIKRGADVFAKDKYGFNALHHLAWSSGDQAEQVRDLIEMGVSLADKDFCDGYQPIHEAVERGNNELVKVFLDLGADVNALITNDEFPLYIAAREGHPAVLKTLLQRGADIDLKTVRGYTALHIACRNFEEDNIRLLLSAGADVLVEDLEGKTPLDLVDYTVVKRPSMIRPIIKALALKKNCLKPSIESKYREIMREHPCLQSYYQDCMVYISRMKFTRFFKSCTFFDLLMKNRCQIATLMRNLNFRTNFQLYDLNGFSMYAEDILGAFERAQNHYHARLEQEDAINEAVHYVLPNLVVRKVVGYIFDCCERFSE